MSTPATPDAATPSRERRGFALVTCILAIVLIGALMAGAFFASTQEYRIGRNTLVSQRAFAIAEYGLNHEISYWDRTRDLLGSTNYLNIGQSSPDSFYVAAGDSAKVRVTRINNNAYLVVSTGNAAMNNGEVRSYARTSAVVRLAYPTVNVQGGMTTGANLSLSGNASISGYDSTGMTNANFTSLNQWSQCSQIAAKDLPGVTAGLSTTVSTGGSSSISGAPTAVAHSASAGDSTTYVSYGSETWNSLVSNADIVLPAGTYAPGPSLNPLGACDYTNTSNWGDPLRPGTAVACRNYFPIIYVNGDATFHGGVGQGILLVNGSLTMNGGFQFYGLVIVAQDILRSNGNADIFGAMMARGGTVGTSSTSLMLGTQAIHFSNCAFQSALRGSSILTPVKRRSWAEYW